MTDDEKISQRYREMGAEEPPRALDDAILAASRSVRGGRQRWVAPLAVAAVLVLTVALTQHMQLEQPEFDAPVPRAKEQAPPAAQPPTPAAADSAAKAVPARVKPKLEAPAAPATRAEPRGFVSEPPAPAMSSSAPAPAARASGTVAGLAAERDMRADRARTQAESPERELERIAGLRVQGRHEEADRALAEFRKRYPEYRIPEEMRPRVERR